MSKTPAAASAAADTQAFGHAVTEMWKAMAGLSAPPTAMSSLQADYLKQATDLWNAQVERFTGEGAPAQPAKFGDRRFAAADWAANPAAALAAQTYLLNARTLMQMADALQGDAKTKARVRFAVQQWVDAASKA